MEEKRAAKGFELEEGRGGVDSVRALSGAFPPHLRALQQPAGGTGSFLGVSLSEVHFGDEGELHHIACRTLPSSRYRYIQYYYLM